MKQSNSSKKIKLSNPKINKVDDHIDRGFEFILKGGQKKRSKSFYIQFPGGKHMTIDTDIVLSLLLPVSLLFFFVGIIGGWIARDYMLNYREIPRPHPEMFDINGNLVPDEVIAFNFENYHDDNESSEEDD